MANASDDTSRVGTAEWLKEAGRIPEFLAARAGAEQRALADFLAKRTAELREPERSVATNGPLAADLRRRLREAAIESLEHPSSAVSMDVRPYPADRAPETGIATVVLSGQTDLDLLRDLESALFSIALERVWPEVLGEWRRENGAPLDYFRLPFALRDPHKVLGGRRHGKAVNLPVSSVGEVGADRVRLVVQLPKRKGSQLSLELEAKLRASGEGLTPDTVLRLIRDATGPDLAMIGHAAFALAHEDAQREGRVFDGRFWYYPTRIANLLGYSGSTSAKRARALFEAYGSTVLRGTWRTGDGTEWELSGPLLYTTEQQVTRRTPGRAGRDRMIEWRIRDALVELTRKDFVLVPRDLLGCGEEDPRTWANCMRVYEELAWRFRRNASEAGAGEAIRVSLPALANGVNLSPPGRSKRSLQVADLRRFMDKLERRGAIRWEGTEVAGGPGALVTLTDPEICKRLAATGQRAALLKGSGRRR